MTQENSNLPAHETQQERWFKYGANVVLVSVIVVLLAVAVIYLSERKPHRIDTTAGGLYSLKPQTLAVIKDNKQPITIISLYTKAKKGQTADEADADDSNSAAVAVDEPGVVADLLEEYRTRGANIKTENIDPVLSPTKVDDLINDVQTQYGGEIQKYKSFAAALPAKYDSISKLANGETDVIQKLPLDQIQSEEVQQTVLLAFLSVKEIPPALKSAQEEYAKSMKKKVPDYKGVTDSVADTMTRISALTAKVMDGFNTAKDDKAVPLAIRQYMTESLPKYTEIKKEADDLLAEQKKLGELKLDTLREALRQKNPILVRGDKEWRVLPYDKVWKLDSRDVRGGAGSAAPKARFAGEQQITTAIVSLNQPSKPKVCFVRGGGQPVTDFGGRLNSVADRLRDYNFDVTEKDLSGMYAMQAMQQQQPAPPEPSDDEIADAVWVVDGFPQQSNPMMGGPPTSIAGKVADHMTKGFHYENGKKLPGGAALLMFISPHGDDMAAALKPFGITARTDAMIIHKAVPVEGGEDGNMINSALRNPPIFTFSQWGDHMITQPLNSLLGLMLQASPIQVTPTAGVKSTAIIPVPGAPDYPESWGTTNPTPNPDPKFDKNTDIAPPIFAGAVAEKDGQRLVCLGSEAMVVGSVSGDGQTPDLVDLPVQPLYNETGKYVPQFPGSGEFFMNSVFWLSHQETMIAISPAAMNVSRIANMSPGMLKFWKIGVLLIGLPGLVLLAGAGMYFSRRD